MFMAALRTPGRPRRRRSTSHTQAAQRMPSTEYSASSASPPSYSASSGGASCARSAGAANAVRLL